MIAERVFGFEGHMEESVKDPLKGALNARALANALLCCLLVPWAFCLLFYCGACLTYSLGSGTAHCNTSLPELRTPHGIHNSILYYQDLRSLMAGSVGGMHRF